MQKPATAEKCLINSFVTQKTQGHTSCERVCVCNNLFFIVVVVSASGVSLLNHSPLNGQLKWMLRFSGAHNVAVKCIFAIRLLNSYSVLKHTMREKERTRVCTDDHIMPKVSGSKLHHMIRNGLHVLVIVCCNITLLLN